MNIINRIKNKINSELSEYKKLKEAKNTITKLSQEMKKDEVYVIMPILIGDFCYAMAYLNDYCARQKINDMKVKVFIPSNRCALFELYEANCNAVILDKDSKEYEQLLNIIVHQETVMLAQNFRIYGTIPWFFVKKDGNVQRDGLEILRNSLLMIGDHVTIQFPRVKKEPVSAIENFEQNKAKIVVINPYSNSMREGELLVFEEVAKILKKEGYLVYTNVMPDQQVIAGTRPLNCNIFELYNICNEIPFFISIRSGIIDFCVSTSAKFFVIYFGSNKKTRNDFFHLYNLHAWGRNNTKEILYDDMDTLKRELHLFINKI